MAPGQAGQELGRRLQVDGGTVGTGCQDVDDILPQESGPVDGPVGQVVSPHSPLGDSFRETSPVLALQDGIATTPGRPSPGLLLLRLQQCLLPALAAAAAGRAAL